MYFPVDLFRQLITDPTKPKGRRRVGWHNGTPRLTNTDFTNLAQSGLIGSSGAGTSVIAEVVAEGLDAGRGVVVVRDETEDGVDRRQHA
jgi:ABC-type transport system involved in cytochrome bd biosynthesis fused ATPase/permease subunit